MSVTLTFDVYGTLIDTHGVVIRLQEYIGDKAQEFSQVWRDKQLEYSFRRGLMQAYETFAVCTSQALDYTDSFLGTALTAEQKTTLLAEYRTLPAFDDVKVSLEGLKAEGYALYAFSNGTADAVEGLLAAAGIDALFDGVVSVNDQQTFKPSPDVYRHLLDTTNASASETWLISSNPFDVIGAVSFGLNSAWVQRSNNSVFDPWGIEPTHTITTLRELAGVV
ncbi:haloacid dehalogenase type II [Solemya velum gill symbiont]|uniref:(S)-2-haloacid dehalogenase n=1 Tax=Solemya velum gill symbiont TaxID=2340 RepID=A0A0B0H8Q9_SOVGS|nr:haloacid dehalogenase type II [Solemya velum gill symbiont]KHF25047.1 2-haloalkanoic acid dehalogenase [Solemya velum gill symbiont]OOZ12364.1 haloacid dehalogenase, type II [Solemya velum gill symbiont]OOZ43192.1 haloacid dehalogenase, type II [Solemya velum gill symbiont]OOZ44059.1 haloacid dehalogenase, type II [Solemya velum gill symbiont]OOZ48142.1 haloacid dehalogenase, type II [Solemya velum gill symbiont]